MISDVKRAAERHLSQISPAVPTAYEGVSFTPPSTGVHQLVQLVIKTPDDPVLGTGFHRENVEFQVFVVGNANKGTAEILARAELIREQFKKGTVLQEGTVRIHVLKTPRLAGVIPAEDSRIVCPVMIELTAEVYSY